MASSCVDQRINTKKKQQQKGVKRDREREKVKKAIRLGFSQRKVWRREREKTSIQKPIAVGSFDVEAEAAAVAVEALDKYRAFRVDANKLTGARISLGPQLLVSQEWSETCIVKLT